MTVTAPQMADLLPDARQLLSDEPPMESTQHYQQLALLVSSLEWRWQDRDDFFIGANLTVYYSHQQLRRREFCGPDFFLVRGVSREPRNSWVVWEEGGRYPDLIIELLSDSTAGVDRTGKKTLYQDTFRTPEYFWFSPMTLEFAGFRLTGQQYEAIPSDARGWRWSEALGLYLGIADGQLRYFDAGGVLAPTPAEAARQAQQHAEQAQQYAEQERRWAERLAQQLRELGIEPQDRQP